MNEAGKKLAALRREVEALRDEEREYVRAHEKGDVGRKASIVAASAYRRVLNLIAKHEESAE